MIPTVSKTAEPTGHFLSSGRARGSSPARSCQIVTINDDIPPVLMVPDDVKITCEDPTDPGFTGQGVCFDNCDPNPIDATFTDAVSGNCPTIITRTWTCMDKCGNRSIADQIITINDDVPPTIVCPASLTISCDQKHSFTVTADDNCDDDLPISCTFTDAADPDRFVAVPLGGGQFSVTITGSTVVFISCETMDDCGNVSDPCTFTLDAECGQACSPGFWRNNLDEWCDFTPFNPLQDYCSAGLAPTGFLEAFELAACPAAPSRAAIAGDPGLTLHEAVNKSGGANQTLFHGSAALLNAYAVAFPVGVDAVVAVMQDACDGSIGWTEAFHQFRDWNAFEDDGGCPFSSSSAAPTRLPSGR